MKAIPQVSAAIRSANDITALPRLTADWNMNRYFDTRVINTPSEDTDGNDVEMFPIESITEPVRPTKGINKARINQSKVDKDYSDPTAARFYVASVDDKYKYWQSPTVSDAGGNITGVLPTVNYGTWNADKTGFTTQTVKTNKIVVKLENSWASPITWNIQVNDGSGWSTVASNPVIANDGSVTIYWNGSAWTQTQPVKALPGVTTSSVSRTLYGVRLSVTKLGPGKDRRGNTTNYLKTSGAVGSSYVTTATTGGNSFFSLIELGLHWEVDLTNNLISVEDTFDLADVSSVYPIGSLTTNDATVVLWNGQNNQGVADPTFNQLNPSSPYFGLLEANVEFNLEYVYMLASGNYAVQQFKMYTENWTGQSEANVNVTLSDFSRYFQNNHPLPVMYENLTLPEIVYRLCDSVGFVDYDVSDETGLVNYIIPVFYTDGEKTVWEVLDDLAKATQSAIYFDGNGRMKVKTREAAFKKNAVKSWTLRGETPTTGQSGFGELADIVEMSQSEEFESNLVTVSYSTTAWSDWNNGLPAMQTVWEPEGTENLRACPLIASLPTTLPVEGINLYFKITPQDAKIFPYYGLVNIESEIIKFEGKRFIYYTDTVNSAGVVTTPANVRNIAVINDEDEYKKYNEKIGSSYRFKNYFDGYIRITERGMWNSQVSAHNVEADGYSVHGWMGGKNVQNTAGLFHQKQESRIILGKNGRMLTGADFLLATRGATDDQPFVRYGTKFRFEKGAGLDHQTAGIVINHSNPDGRQNGYFLEVIPTNKLTTAQRAQRNELILYSRTNGTNVRVGGNGTALNITEGVEYELDMLVDNNGTGGHTITIWVNGVLAMRQTAPTTARQAPNGKFGLFTRGKTRVSFEYLYAVKNARPDIPDNFSYYDKIKGGYVGGLFDREWVYGWKSYTRRVKKKTIKGQSRWSDQFMDEFGPIVHEIREYEVTFDPAPVLHSRLFSTNDYSSACIEYSSNAFGAKFVIANTSRDNATINGEETVTYSGRSGTVNHVLSVIGRALVIADAATVEAKNEKQIRSRGEIESTVESPWIQSEKAAQSIADWVANHWSEGVENQSVTIFGNPLIEIGDIVDVFYEDKKMAGTRFFVLAATNSFDTGLETTLTLRRIGPDVV